MLQHEFAELMGIDKNLITEEEYTTANAVYMMKETDAACYDKQHFVRRWKELQKDALFMAVVKNALAAGTEVYQLQKELAAKTKQVDAITKNFAKTLIETADRHCNDTETAELMRRKARAMLGEREYYAMLMLHGCPTEEDVKEVAAILMQNK